MHKNVLIVGANGYLGSSLYQKAQKSFRVWGTSTKGGNGNLVMNLEFLEDFDYKWVKPSMVVFLTAAISAPDICAREYDRAWSLNVSGTSSFIRSVIDRGARVIFFSSDTVYGEREHTFEEVAPCHPAGEYAEMKHEVEQRFSGDASFKAIRLSYVFSKEDKFSRYLVACAERNEKAVLFHPFFRAIVHRDDVIEGALALATCWNEVPEQVINFGGPQLLSRIDFAECLREAYLHDLQFSVLEPSADFFKNRPRTIAMASPIFTKLLGRPLRTLQEAAHLEFASSSNTEKNSWSKQF